MSVSSKRMLVVLLSLVLLGAAIFIYVSLIQPAYSDIDGLRAKEFGLNQNYDNFVNLNKKFQSLFADYQGLGDLQNKLAMIFPPKLSVDYTLTQILGLVKLSGLEVQSISLKQAPVKNLGVLKINIRLSGPYENFKSFIQKLESNVLIFDIDNFSITADPSGNLTYDLLINTYYQAE